MTDLIYSRTANDRFLTAEEVKAMAPAAYATSQSAHLSGRYGQVTTADAITALADYGFQPVQAAQKDSRKGSPMHAEHLIAFADCRGELQADGHRGEIVLYNSHDGTSSLKLFGGAFRFICSNGIVAGEGFEARMRHTKGTVGGFEDMLKDTAANLPRLMGRIDELKATEFSPDDALQFAYNASKLRWEWLDPNETVEDAVFGAFANHITAQDLLRTYRIEDRGQNAWAVFNRCQERLIRGGARVASITPKRPNGTYRRSRAIGSVKASVDINRKLWDLVENHTAGNFKELELA